MLSSVLAQGRAPASERARHREAFTVRKPFWPDASVLAEGSIDASVLAGGKHGGFLKQEAASDGPGRQ